MIFYLSFNDAPSGIFSSQVIDVVKFLRNDLKVNIRLVSFISLRNYLQNRKAIKKELNDAIVLPMFPGVHRWKQNTRTLSLLCSYKKPEMIIGRSVLATQLALYLKKRDKVKKVIYDGRGAIAAEWKEYGVITNELMLNEIGELENEAIHESDYRIAVSEKLIQHWQKKFQYVSGNHVIIPCTLNTVYENFEINDSLRLKKRQELGFSDSDKVFVYSGSVAGWQSFGLLYNFIKPLLLEQSNVKVLFLSSQDQDILKLENEFPGRIACIRLPPSQVPAYLACADYGLLLREKTITNKVASPVKFAEYLACGLPVIISEELGDYSDFVKQNNCGCIMDTFSIKATFLNKKSTRELALKHFSKKSFLESYGRMLG
ncbi:MAG: hypothetical protein H0W61_08305 [Bacteroidetes bacterium]|nr:hypothetical protein [Bacteroidota bacterium]